MEDTKRSKADAYSETHPHDTAPKGAVAMAEVVIFDDGSVHVGGPAIQYGEEYLVAALKFGIELLGYDVTMEKNPDGVGNNLVLVNVIDPLDAMLGGDVALA